MSARLGNCYEVHGAALIDAGLKLDDYPAPGGVLDTDILCHGVICPIIGPLHDHTFTHAWLERGDLVIDISNDREIVTSKEDYYLLAGTDESKVKRYTFEQCRRMILVHGHWGPWDSWLQTIAKSEDTRDYCRG